MLKVKTTENTLAGIEEVYTKTADGKLVQAAEIYVKTAEDTLDLIFTGEIPPPKEIKVEEWWGGYDPNEEYEEEEPYDGEWCEFHVKFVPNDEGDKIEFQFLTEKGYGGGSWGPQPPTEYWQQGNSYVEGYDMANSYKDVTGVNAVTIYARSVRDGKTSKPISWYEPYGGV